MGTDCVNNYVLHEGHNMLQLRQLRRSCCERGFDSSETSLDVCAYSAGQLDLHQPPTTWGTMDNEWNCVAYIYRRIGEIDLSDIHAISLLQVHGKAGSEWHVGQYTITLFECIQCEECLTFTYAVHNELNQVMTITKAESNWLIDMSDWHTIIFVRVPARRVIDITNLHILGVETSIQAGRLRETKIKHGICMDNSLWHVQLSFIKFHAVRWLWR
jgi:hypothetical protein